MSGEEIGQARLTLADVINLRWWATRAWFRRCPECGARGRGNSPAPRWEDDKIAQMLGVAAYGCPRCGQGSVEERDAVCEIEHADRCCRYHGHHVNPHRGCVLR